VSDIEAIRAALDGADPAERPDVVVMAPEWWARIKPALERRNLRNRAGHRPARKRLRRLAKFGL